jgi:2,3-dihydroxy-p-cumate/2,3-dihydroxybenzoate 3,4-dioxygenase
MTCSADHHTLILFAGAPGLKRLGWQLQSEQDLDRLAAVLARNGLPVAEVPRTESTAMRQGRSLRFHDPFTAATHEYYVRMDQAAEPWRPTVASIQRLGHVVLKAPNYSEAVRFYTEVLNFRISDTIGDRVSFLRCFPNRFHHSLGLSNASTHGLHHVSFMVDEIDDIGRGMWRFIKNEVPIVRGPGRHPPSNSVFLYVLDPDGLTVEYSYGMEEFPEVGAREHRVLPLAPESIDYWGAPTDKRLGMVGEIESISPQV